VLWPGKLMQLQQQQIPLIQENFFDKQTFILFVESC
jgi:hypothetical protein